MAARNEHETRTPKLQGSLGDGKPPGSIKPQDLDYPGGYELNDLVDLGTTYIRHGLTESAALEPGHEPQNSEL